MPAADRQKRLRCGPDDLWAAPEGGHRGPERRACLEHERAPAPAGTPENGGRNHVGIGPKAPDRLPPMPAGSRGYQE